MLFRSTAPTASNVSPPTTQPTATPAFAPAERVLEWQEEEKEGDADDIVAGEEVEVATPPGESSVTETLKQETLVVK